MRPCGTSDYPVYLIDSNGNKQVVYFGIDRYKQRRFQESQKFKQAKEYGWSWS